MEAKNTAIINQRHKYEGELVDDYERYSKAKQNKNIFDDDGGDDQEYNVPEVSEPRI